MPPAAAIGGEREREVASVARKAPARTAAACPERRASTGGQQVQSRQSTAPRQYVDAPRQYTAPRQYNATRQDTAPRAYSNGGYNNGGSSNGRYNAARTYPAPARLQQQRAFVQPVVGYAKPGYAPPRAPSYRGYAKPYYSKPDDGRTTPSPTTTTATAACMATAAAIVTRAS